MFLACEAEQFLLLSRPFAASHILYNIAKTRTTRSDEHVDILLTQVKEKPVCCQIPPGLAYLQDLPAETGELSHPMIQLPDAEQEKVPR